MRMNNGKDMKRRVDYELLIFLGIVALMTFIVRLWPLLLLAMVCMLICALRMLFLRFKTVEVIVPAVAAEPPPPESELSIMGRAFGLLQRRITEHLEQQYPGARWVWGTQNAMERFKRNEPLIIFLNSAGGYNKAQVVVNNLMFVELRYQTLEPEVDLPAEPTEPISPDDLDDPDDSDGTDTEEENTSGDEPINYGRLAFDWVDANMVDINAKYNEAIAENKTVMLIPAEELPHPDSWPDVCAELRRNGFDLADFCEDGIQVNITQ